MIAAAMFTPDDVKRTLAALFTAREMLLDSGRADQALPLDGIIRKLARAVFGPDSDNILTTAPTRYPLGAAPVDRTTLN